MLDRACADENAPVKLVTDLVPPEFVEVGLGDRVLVLAFNADRKRPVDPVDTDVHLLGLVTVIDTVLIPYNFL